MGKKRSKLKLVLKNTSRNLARLYREQVIKQYLVDTGLMRDSFTVNIQVDKNGSVEIQVSSVFYFQYINESPHFFDVTGKLFASKAYKKLEEDLITFIAMEFSLNFLDTFEISDTVEYFIVEPTGKFYKGGQFMPGGKRAPKGGIKAEVYKHS